MNLVEKIKQHWKVILICLLTMMWMSKCTTSCSQERTIKTIKTELHQKDSVIAVRDSVNKDLNSELTLYKALYDSEKSHNNDVSNISKMTLEELRVKVQKLTNENTNQKRIIDGLTKENQILRTQLDTTLRK
mgnify:CR=1 FL=1